MNKRIASLLLCFVMVFALMAITTPAFADTSVHPPVTFTIKPDKTTAKPGDTITYQAIIGPVEKLQAAQFKLVIPEELKYTGGSSPEGLTEKLNAASAEFTSSTMKFVLGGTNYYTSNSDTLLATFTCKVKAGVAAGKMPVVTVINDEGDFFFADSDEKYYTINYNPSGAAVTIAAEEKPATGITLNKSELTLTAGESDTSLTAAVTPEGSTDTVVWSSSKTDVATVDSATGKVTAVAPGEATITATAGTKTATCTVKVQAAPCEHGSIRIEVPFKLTVKKTGEMAPGQETFKFAVEKFGAPTTYTVVQDTVETNGEKTYEGKFIFTIRDDEAGNLSEGFVIRQVKGNAAGWTYDETMFYAVPLFVDSYESVGGWSFFKFDQNNELDYNNPIREIGFTNSFNAKMPVTPPAPEKPDTPPAPQKPESPKTGDGSMMGLSIALVIVSGAALMGTALYSRRKSR